MPLVDQLTDPHGRRGVRDFRENVIGNFKMDAKTGWVCLDLQVSVMAQLIRDARKRWPPGAKINRADLFAWLTAFAAEQHEYWYPSTKHMLDALRARYEQGDLGK